MLHVADRSLDWRKEFAFEVASSGSFAGDGRVMAGRETFGCNSSAAFRGFMATIWIPGASAAIWMPLWFNREHQRELEGRQRGAPRLRRGEARLPTGMEASLNFRASRHESPFSPGNYDTVNPYELCKCRKNPLQKIFTKMDWNSNRIYDKTTRNYWVVLL